MPRSNKKSQSSALHLFLVTTGAVFLVQLALMILFDWVPPLPAGQMTLLVASALSLIVSGMISVIWYQPLMAALARAQNLRVTAEQCYQSIFENAHDGVFQSTLDGKLITVNPAFATMHGYGSPAECVAAIRDITDQLYVDPSRRAEFRQLLKERGEVRGFENQVYRKDRSIMWVSTSAWVARDSQGKVLYYEGFVGDITGRKQAEEAVEQSRAAALNMMEDAVVARDGAVKAGEALRCEVKDRRKAEDEVRRLNADLEQRVTARTAELQAANKELEAFSYSVSHDLRAPLRGISGFASILVEDYAKHLDEEGRRLLGTICGEASRMGQMIDELLAFSRLGRQSMQSAETDMTSLAQTAFDQCAAQVSGRNIQFKLPPLPPAQGDAAMLSHVWVNLISNAIKYTRPKPAAEIEVTGRTEDSEMVYCVKDNGAGFDMKYVQKLFGVFQRLHNETDFEGTGIGLALAQRIVQRHGGRVWAEGEVNKGATFYFTLPVVAEGSNP